MAAQRIAIVFRGIGDIGGTNNTIADHARYFTDRGAQVDLIGEKVHRGGVTPEMGRGVRIRRLPAPRRYKWRWFAARAQAVVDRGGYDFVAGHGHHYRQHVLSMHNCMHLARQWIGGEPLAPAGTLAEIHDRIFAAGGFRYCICNSKLMQADLAARYGVDVGRLPVVYPGYRPAQFSHTDRARYREPVRAELGAEREHLLVGLVTSGDYANRGLGRLIEAVAGLESALRERTLLVVVGKTAGIEPYLAQARALGLADRLRTVGASREPQRYIHALDVCVHPASIETFGQTIQEAMVCGVPVITSRRCGAAELFPPALQAELLDTPQVEAIGRRLADYLGSAERRRRVAELGQAAFAANTRQANFEQTMAVYRRAGLTLPA